MRSVRVCRDAGGFNAGQHQLDQGAGCGVIKAASGLVRNIEKRTENQLLVQSLVEACKGTRTQVFATGVRSRSEWQMLTERGVTGGQGDFFAASAA
jgi:EAL domain-containing protein (putative c-di-GMP-specific phosphodiesterase class I)